MQVEAKSPRVVCGEHGVVVARVPWARARAGFTRAFEDLVAWLAVKTDRSALAELLRVAWRSVGKVLTRVLADERKRVDAFANLERIGIDEISYKKRHRYLTVVVNHETGRLVWAGEGRDGYALHEPVSPRAFTRARLAGDGRAIRSQIALPTVRPAARGFPGSRCRR